MRCYRLIVSASATTMIEHSESDNGHGCLLVG